MKIFIVCQISITKYITKYSELQNTKNSSLPLKRFYIVSIKIYFLYLLCILLNQGWLMRIKSDPKRETKNKIDF